VEMIYTKFVSLISSTPVVQTLLPLSPSGEVRLGSVLQPFCWGVVCTCPATAADALPLRRGALLLRWFCHWGCCNCFAAAAAAAAAAAWGGAATWRQLGNQLRQQGGPHKRGRSLCYLYLYALGPGTGRLACATGTWCLQPSSPCPHQLPNPSPCPHSFQQICDINGNCVDAAEDEVFKLNTREGQLVVEAEKVGSVCTAGAAWTAGCECGRPAVLQQQCSSCSVSLIAFQRHATASSPHPHPTPPRPCTCRCAPRPATLTPA